MKIMTNIEELVGPAPLYCQSTFEPEPFPAYVQIDPTRRLVTFGVDGDQRTTPENLYCGRVYRVELPNNLTLDSIQSTFKANLPRIAKIMAGYSETLDQHGDGIGHLNAVAQEALAELRAELEGIDASDGLDVYSSSAEYLDIFDFVQANSSDAALSQIAEKIAADQGIAFADDAVTEDILAALIAKRAEQLRDAED